MFENDVFLDTDFILVLLQFQGTLANLPKAVYPSIERQATLIAAYQPESDLTALIERYRTGPFRPDPQVLESLAYEEFDVVFGIDLRKWAEGGWFALTSGEEKKDIVPLVVTALLNGLDEAYPKMPNDDGKVTGLVHNMMYDIDRLTQRNARRGYMKSLFRQFTFSGKPLMLFLLINLFPRSFWLSMTHRSLLVLSNFGCLNLILL